MEIYDYRTISGKNVIIDYVDDLPRAERLELYDIRNEIRRTGLDAFEKLNTRQLRGKLWEIKSSKTRIMYVIIDSNGVVFLHICKKQKGKAEKQELDKALRRAKKKVYYRSSAMLEKSNGQREIRIVEEIISDDEELKRQHEIFEAEMAFKQELIDARKREALTQKDISRMTGLSQQAVSRLEKKASGTMNTIIRYLNSMGYSLSIRKD